MTVNNGSADTQVDRLGAPPVPNRDRRGPVKEGAAPESTSAPPLTLDGLAQLEGHVAHLVDGVGQVVVVFEEIEGAKAQKLKGDTHVAMVVKPVEHLDTEAGKRDGKGK